MPMPSLADALGKTKADTLYEAKAATVNTSTGVRPSAPTYNDTTKAFTIPASTAVDYYEWQGIYGWVIKAAGTYTRSNDATILPNQKQTRILVRPKTGYVVLGPAIFSNLYT